MHRGDLHLYGHSHGTLPWDGVVDVARVAVHQGPGGTIQGIWCSHYAHRVWPGQHRGDIHLYGYSHGKLPGPAMSTDVGVDCFDYRPSPSTRSARGSPRTGPRQGGDTTPPEA